MNYDLIFYLSKRTGYCEKQLRRAFLRIGAEPSRITAATAPTALGEEVMLSLRRCPLAVIVGGLSSPDDDNLATVLSRALSTSGLTLSNMRRLVTDSGQTGYVIRYKNQAILALPDDPQALEELLSDDLLRYLKEKLNSTGAKT